MITDPAYMQLYILCTIKYHDQYKCSNKLCLITYHIFSHRLIFLNRGLHSGYNCFISHNIFVIYKQDTKTWIRIQILFITVSYRNFTFLLALKTLLLSQYWFSSVHIYLQKIFLSYFCDIPYPYDIDFIFGLYSNLFSLRLSSDTTLRLLLWV